MRQIQVGKNRTAKIITYYNSSNHLTYFADLLNLNLLKIFSVHDIVNNIGNRNVIHSELLRPTRSLVFDPWSDTGILSRAHLFTFVFIRHPLQRLVSAYNDKFSENKNRNFINSLKNNVNLNRLPNGKISFEQFLNFVIFEVSSNSMSEGSFHWWPYSKLCHMCQIDYSYIGTLEVST